jgi:hypothetical protein
VEYVSYERNVSTSKDIYTYHILLTTNAFDILKLLSKLDQQSFDKFKTKITNVFFVNSSSLGLTYLLKGK